MVNAVAFSPDGRRALTGSQDHTAILWDAASGKRLQAFEGHLDAVTSVAFSPDGRQVLTGSWDKTAILWDAATGERLSHLSGTPCGGRPARRIGLWPARPAGHLRGLRARRSGRWWSARWTA